VIWHIKTCSLRPPFLSVPPSFLLSLVPTLPIPHHEEKEKKKERKKERKKSLKIESEIPRTSHEANSKQTSKNNNNYITLVASPLPFSPDPGLSADRHANAVRFQI